MFIVEKKTPMKSAMNSQTIFENYDLDQQLKIIKVNFFNQYNARCVNH